MFPRHRIVRSLCLILLVTFFGACARFQIPLNETIREVVLANDLDSLLQEREAAFGDITPGAEKTILWARTDQAQTEFSVVYLHGFSATRQETAPLAEWVAMELGANLYYPRLTGHGRGGEALAQATVNDWLNDTVEALEIGQRIGEKVIIMGTSTGGTLAAWLAGSPYAARVHAYILISPNFGPKDSKANMLTWPFAQIWVPWIVGPTRTWEPYSDLNARYWTWSYPIEALFPMMGLVELAREVDPAKMDTPILIINSPTDTVVDADRTTAFYTGLNVDPRQHIEVLESGDPDNHVLAGDILSPETTGTVAEHIVTFLERLDMP